MKIYITIYQHNEDTIQVFNTFEKAKDFALTKANKRGCVNVWDTRETDYKTRCLNKNVNGEHHIYIIEKEVM